jgi:segregation and condensation protein B
MELEKQIESYLFFVGEPVEKTDLAQTLKVKEEELEGALENLRASLRERGIVLISTETSVTLGTHPEMGKILERIQKEALDKDLTKAALETLSVILYHEDPSRSDIDYIRGVNSQFSVRALMMRGLIERLPHPKDNRKYMYKPTPALLEYLGVADLKELPNYEEVRGLIVERIKKSEEGVKE